MIAPHVLQQMLRDLISQYGLPNENNSHIYYSILKTNLTSEPREEGLLELSIHYNIPNILYNNQNNPNNIDYLIQELTSKYQVDSHAAEWIVKTWGKSLGMSVSSNNNNDTLKKIQNERDNTQNEGNTVRNIFFSKRNIKILFVIFCLIGIFLVIWFQLPFWEDRDRSKTMGKDHHNRTLKEANEAIELNPQDAIAWFDKGYALEALGYDEEAEDAYNQAVLINPNYAAAWNSLGCLYLKYYTYSNLEVKTDYFDRAIKANPNYIPAIYNKAYTLTFKCQYVDALNTFKNVVKIKPKDAQAWTDIGYILLGQEGYNQRVPPQYSEAIDACNKAIELDPRDPGPWRVKKIALEKLKRYDEAKEAEEKTLELKAWGSYSENYRSYEYDFDNPMKMYGLRRD